MNSESEEISPGRYVSRDSGEDAVRESQESGMDSSTQGSETLAVGAGLADGEKRLWVRASPKIVEALLQGKSRPVRLSGSRRKDGEIDLIIEAVRKEELVDGTDKSMQSQEARAAIGYTDSIGSRLAEDYESSCKAAGVGGGSSLSGLNVAIELEDWPV